MTLPHILAVAGASLGVSSSLASLGIAIEAGMPLMRLAAIVVLSINIFLLTMLAAS